MVRDQTRSKLMWLITLCWLALALYCSWHRSIWQDEVQRFVQMKMSFVESLRSLLLEPSPFAPGEILLGRASQFLFGAFTPFEFWARIPSVIWGALTIILTMQRRSLLFTLMVALSVSLLQFSTQYRPYSALIFNGAIAFRLLIDTKPLSRLENVFCWVGLFFGHIYGICYQAFSAMWRRQWLTSAAGFVYVAVILTVYSRFHSGGVSAWTTKELHYDLRAMLELTSLTVGGSNRVSQVLTPFAFWGSLLLVRRNLTLALKLLSFFFVCMIAPQLANWYGHYPFVPRQVVSGVFPFLYLASLGVEALKTPLRRYAWCYPGLVVIICAVMLRALVIYVTDGRPPYAEQPLHKHRQRIQESRAANDHNVLVLDPGGTSYMYFDEALGQKPQATSVTKGGYPLAVRCWNTYCTYHFDVAEFAWKNLNELGNNLSFMSFVNGSQPKFDRILVNAYKLELPTTVPISRLW